VSLRVPSRRAIRGSAEARRRGAPPPWARTPTARTALVFAIVLVLLPVGIGHATASPARQWQAATPPGSTAPSVHASANASGAGTLVNSGPMSVLAGDALVALVAIRGSTDVRSVTDSVGDAFSELAYQSRTDNSSREGLSIWAAPNVLGGPQVTVTATSSTSLRLVLLAIDVTGVSATSPVDNVSMFYRGTNATIQDRIPATANDVVFLAVGVEGGVQTAPSGGDALVTQLTYSLAPKDTGAVYEVTAPTTGNQTMNATLSPAGPWISAGLSLRPPAADPSHKIWNVVVIYLENADLQDINRLSGVGYLKYLSSKYVNSTGYYGVCHPSAPNYLALIDGNPQQCGSDTVHLGRYHNTTLPDLLEAHHLTWGGYFESMPRACDGTNGNNYVARHNPFVFFQSIWANTSRCTSHVVNSAAFNTSISTNHTFPANVSLYVPDLIDDGHSSSASTASSWLHSFLGKILNTSDSRFRQAVNHTLFLVTFDESDDTSAGKGIRGDGSVGNTTSYDGAGYNGTFGGNLWLGVVNIGGYVIHGHYTANSSHYRLLSTIEWLFHLGNTGGMDASSRFPPMTNLFTFSSNGY
jgi:Phosphoesterase family